MGTWSTRGLRGSGLEDLINYTIESLREKKLAVIQKVPTPITPMKIDSENRHITLAYFEQKSTVDYIGVIQGIPVCFDAKECRQKTFALQNIHPHQVEFMKAFEEQEGLAFFLISYTLEDFYYYLPLRHFLPFWERAQAGGRKSFRMDELDMNWVLPKKPGVLVPYLEMINRDLAERESDRD